jgi:hypothetical protein
MHINPDLLHLRCRDWPSRVTYCTLLVWGCDVDTIVRDADLDIHCFTNITVHVCYKNPVSVYVYIEETTPLYVKDLAHIDMHSENIWKRLSCLLHSACFSMRLLRLRRAYDDDAF